MIQYSTCLLAFDTPTVKYDNEGQIATFELQILEALQCEWDGKDCNAILMTRPGPVPAADAKLRGVRTEDSGVVSGSIDLSRATPGTTPILTIAAGCKQCGAFSATERIRFMTPER